MHADKNNTPTQPRENMVQDTRLHKQKGTQRTAQKIETEKGQTHTDTNTQRHTHKHACRHQHTDTQHTQHIKTNAQENAE